MNPPLLRRRIHTRERRFLFDDPAPVESLLAARGLPIEYAPGRPVTAVTSVYFDTPEGTWSAGRTRTKFRAKSYGDPESWWFELKRRAGNVVDKWRRPVAVAELPGLLDGSARWESLEPFIGDGRLGPLFGVGYRRTAWEWGDLRVTVDREVRFHRVDAGRPGRLLEPFDVLDGVVVEVKVDGPVPDWLRAVLKGRRAKRFSKSRRALAARNGTCRPTT